MPGNTFAPGAADLESRISVLAERLTPGLRPLARVAYNYRWSWAKDGPDVFRDINPHRWALSGENPVRFLGDLWPGTQEAAERDPELLERVRSLADRVAADLDRPARPRPGVDGPVAFMCAEFGFHQSLPIYSGGLGVLAGRHPQGGERPGAADDRDRPPLPPRLLPAADRRVGPPAGVLARVGSEEPADGARRPHATASR